MLREKLARNRVGEEEGFTWRGVEVSRIEGLSDAVFAFAITLLVVSLEVPKTFDELLATMRGFSPSRSASPCCSRCGTSTTSSPDGTGCGTLPRSA